MLSLLFYLSTFLTSIYSLSFKSIQDQQVSMNTFQGKKILLVNVSSGSPRISQLTGLLQLKQQYGDSLAVILFPSNSFGNEPKTNNEIEAYFSAFSALGVIVAEKSDVWGENINPIFQWLSKVADNGVMDAAAPSDFYKFLIERDGRFIGFFAPGVQPTDPEIIDAITNKEE